MKKKTIRILAVASAAALLLGGTVLLFKDDAAQKLSDSRMEEFQPNPSVLTVLDELSVQTETTNDSDTTEDATEIGEETNADISAESVPFMSSDTLPAEVMQELTAKATELNSAYPEAIGWIYIPDTNINYPIMQGEDNDFYLTHGTDGRSLKCGCIELDFRCESRFQNNFNIMYGHNMKNGSMFANVCRFKEKAYYDSHPYGWVYTSDAVYRLDFFSVAVTDWHDEIYNGFRSLDEWIPHLKEISRIYEDVELDEQDRLVLLSTCSYEFENARTVLTGRLVEMESDVNE